MRDRSLRLAAALAVAIAIPVALLFYFQFRAIEDLGRSSTVVLQQLSQETAATLHKDIEDSLKSPYINVLIRITQVRLEPLDLQFIQGAIGDAFANHAFIDRYYVWSDETKDHRDELLVYDRGTPGFHVGAPEGAMLVSKLRELSAEQRAIATFDT